jgi:hypothetical protein
MATETINYAANWATITCGVASLASSSDFTAGRESTAVDNTTNKYVDALVGGKVTVGTSPTSGTQIRIWVYAGYGDTPSYPDVLDGTDSAETFTSAGIRDSSLRLAHTINVDATTSDRTYPFAPFSVASLFGHVPEFWGLFVTHNTGVNLNATAGNHEFLYVGLKYDIA